MFIDLSKAIDTVHHKNLLWKLENDFWMQGTALGLMKSYLNNRYQYSQVLRTKIRSAKNLTRCPSRLILRPSLFLLYSYINDLPQASQFFTTLFADDAYLMMSDENLQSLQNRTKQPLHKIDIWMKNNKFSLNYTKTNYISINNYPKRSINYLGFKVWSITKVEVELTR